MNNNWGTLHHYKRPKFENLDKKLPVNVSKAGFMYSYTGHVEILN